MDSGLLPTYDWRRDNRDDQEIHRKPGEAFIPLLILTNLGGGILPKIVKTKSFKFGLHLLKKMNPFKRGIRLIKREIEIFRKPIESVHYA